MNKGVVVPTPCFLLLKGVVKLIRIYKYYFQPEEVEKERTEKGNTKRSLNGTIHSVKISEYHTWEITIKHLSPTKHGHLLDILDKSRGLEENENLIFIDDLGEEYNVIIPVNGFDFSREEGEKETYEWELTLEEVI